PLNGPARSARSWTLWQSGAITMSFMVLPSPFPLSGSSLVTCVITTEPIPILLSQVSAAVATRAAIVNVRYEWSGFVMATLAVMTGGGLDTWIDAEAELFGAGLGSAVGDVTLAVATMPDASLVEQSLRATVNANCDAAPTARDGIVQLIGPPAPWGGVVQ